MRETYGRPDAELTVPEMAIMITARHLQLREKEPFTFEMCFHELCHFVRRVQRELVSGASESASHSIVAISSINVLAERFYVMQAFHRLLELELLLPESARASLVLPCGVATRTGTVTNAYGTLPAPSVIPEFLPVRAQVTAKAILDSAVSPARVEPLSSILVKWAESTGVA